MFALSVSALCSGTLKAREAPVSVENSHCHKYLFVCLFFICWWVRCMLSCLKTLVHCRIYKWNFNAVIQWIMFTVVLSQIFERLWFSSLFVIEEEKILMLNMSSMKDQQYMGSAEPQSFSFISSSNSGAWNFSMMSPQLGKWCSFYCWSSFLP